MTSITRVPWLGLLCLAAVQVWIALTDVPVALAQLPPRGTTPTPRRTPSPISTPAPQPTTPVVSSPTPTPGIPIVTSDKWRISIDVWDAGNQIWVRQGTYELTGGTSCRLYLDQPCAVRIESK